MLFQKEYRNKELVLKLAEAIRRSSEGRALKFMHVCGTHENTVAKFGLRELLPKSIEIIAGPGCPVCVCPAADIDFAINIAVKKCAILTIFGDMMRVPGSENTLEDVKTQGGDVRIVYSPLDAVDIAKQNPNKQVIFLSVGFETTVCGVASLIKATPPNNFLIISSHRLVPPAMDALLHLEEIKLDGFILPGHVSAIIGLDAYAKFPKEYNTASAVAGFEPVDMLHGIKLLVEQINSKNFKVDNAYERIVTKEGNKKAQKMIEEVFEVCDSNWRGIGIIPKSGLRLREEYLKYDAFKEFPDHVPMGSVDIKPGCICHLIIMGAAKPNSCPLFNNECNPDKPYGPCMVGAEGTCRIWAKYKI